jgi:tetratricopeptide (TPR) repeat protein
MPEGLEPAAEQWRAALAAITDADLAEARRELRRRLSAAASRDDFEAIHGALTGAAAGARRIAMAIQGLESEARTFEEDWRRERRYSDEGVMELQSELLRRAGRRGSAAASLWLGELLRAIDAGEFAAAARLVDTDLPVDGDLHRALAESLAAWKEHHREPLVAALEALAEGRLEGTAPASVEHRTIAARLAAAGAVLRLDDRERGRKLLDLALDLRPADGRVVTERAALRLLEGQIDRAAAGAQRALELAVFEPLTHLVLGACAERTGDYDEADRFYDSGLARMTVHDVTRLDRGATLLVPTGRLQVAAARRLQATGRLEAALLALDSASALGIVGRERFPEAAVFEVRSAVLQEMGDPSAAAAAALEAGKRRMWGGERHVAIEELEQAIALDADLPEAHWVLSDAIMAGSFEVGQAQPNANAVARARAIWDGAAERFGPPSGDLAWAFLTRASIANESAWVPGGDRDSALWEALLFTERTLVLDPGHSHGHALAARFLRALGLEELAYEAIERAYALGARVEDLSERAAILANRGRHDDAEEMAAEVVAQLGTWGWLSGVRAYIAFRRRRYTEALELLELPLSEEFDLGWNYDLAALCHVALGELEEAQRAYRGVVERAKPIHGYTKAQIACAYAALGDVNRARERLEEALQDATLDPVDGGVALAIVALVEGDAGAAAESARASIAAARSPERADAVAWEMRLRARAFPAADADAFTAAVDEAASERLAELARRPRDGAVEVEERLAGEVEPRRRVPLLAIRARRRAEEGELEAAVEDYEALRGTAIDSEAVVALTGLLTSLRDRAVADGAIDAVTTIQDRLMALGGVRDLDAILGTASALAAAGRSEEAVSHLSDAVDDADGDGREDLHEHAGMLALQAGDLGEAAHHLLAAEGIAQGDIRKARLHARLTVAAAAAGDEHRTRREVVEALRAWYSAGIFEPSWTLADDLRAVLDAGLQPAHAKAARDTLRAALRSLGKDGSIDIEATDYLLTDLLGEASTSPPQRRASSARSP